MVRCSMTNNHYLLLLSLFFIVYTVVLHVYAFFLESTPPSVTMWLCPVQSIKEDFDWKAPSSIPNRCENQSSFNMRWKTLEHWNFFFWRIAWPFIAAQFLLLQCLNAAPSTAKSKGFADQGLSTDTLTVLSLECC